MRVLDVAASGKQADASAYTRFYIGDSTEIETKKAAEIYGAELARLGALSGASVNSVPIDKLEG